MKGAQGVPNEKVHGYAFKGTCKLWVESVDVDTGEVKDKHQFRTVWGEAQAKWDGQTSTVAEKIKITDSSGPNSGTIETQLKCTQDPIISSATCVPIAVSNGTKWSGFQDIPTLKKRPILAGVTTLAEASSLSSTSGSGSGAPTPPPPEPKSQPTGTTARASSSGQGGAVADPSGAAAVATGTPERTAPGGAEATTRRSPGGAAAPAASSPAAAAPSAAGPAAVASLLNVEGEEFAASGKVLVGGGRVASQPMTSFGSGWSGGAQLFWSGGSVGAALDLLVDVPAAASYAVEVYLTRAPDYGQVKVQVDGKDVPFTVDAYAPRVMQPSPRQLGKFSLGPGQRMISFLIVGKNAQATGYLVGIDRVRLYPAGAP